MKIKKNNMKEWIWDVLELKETIYKFILKFVHIFLSFVYLVFSRSNLIL